MSSWEKDRDEAALKHSIEKVHPEIRSMYPQESRGVMGMHFRHSFIEGADFGYEQGKLDESNYRECLKTLNAVSAGRDSEVAELNAALKIAGNALLAVLDAHEEMLNPAGVCGSVWVKAKAKAETALENISALMGEGHR